MRQVTIRSPASAPRTPASPYPINAAAAHRECPQVYQQIYVDDQGRVPAPRIRTRFSRILPDPGTSWAGGRRLHITEERMLNSDDTTLTVTVGAGNLASAFGQTRTLAIGARSKTIVDNFLLYARCGFFKHDTQSNTHIAAFFSHVSASSSATAEK